MMNRYRQQFNADTMEPDIDNKPSPKPYTPRCYVRATRAAPDDDSTLQEAVKETESLSDAESQDNYLQTERVRNNTLDKAKTSADNSSSHVRLNINDDMGNYLNKIQNRESDEKLAEYKSSPETDLMIEYKKIVANYRKKLAQEQVQIMEDKQKMIDAEQHFHKIQAGGKFLFHELSAVKLENKKLQRHITLLKEEIRKDYAEMEKNLEERDRQLSKERDTLAIQQKHLENDKALMRVELDQEKKLHNLMFSEQEGKILSLEKTCDNLFKMLEDTKAERDALLAEKKKWSEERENINQINKVYEYNVAMFQVDNKTLKSEIDKLKNFESNSVDLDDLKAQVESTHRKMERLQIENAELKEAASVVEVYKVQIKEQEKDLLQAFQAEQNYLQQIEKLSTENHNLLKENQRLANNPEQQNEA